VNTLLTINGKYNTAKCFCNTIEDFAKDQIQAMCDSEIFANNKIRIMPDVHAGKGCTIGTTMTITDKVVPDMVGVDIGCGMETICLGKIDVDFYKLDDIIRKNIPSGREVRDTHHPFNSQIIIEDLKCQEYVKISRARRSIGTLGGGNHFIEIDKDDEENLYLVIHSGSRHLGKEVAAFYQQEGLFALNNVAHHQITETIARLKAEGRTSEINSTIKEMKRMHKVLKANPFSYVEGKLFDDYINDMKLTQQFALLNRKAMADVILEKMNWTALESFSTIHNYIDTDNMILRKGAVSAQKGEKLLIPINMRDGSLICIGKGNPDWNYSAPHGAGRIMSRKQAFINLSLDEYKKSMENIFSTCVNEDTLDESPMSYKNMDEIVSNISPTADIIKIIKPIYNFKAAE
jgi:RNA-splicing ligase RtcB